jgi:hypothetical protein
MFFYKSECKAYRAGKKCAEAIRATGCCNPAVVDEYIRNSEGMLEYFKCVFRD